MPSGACMVLCAGLGTRLRPLTEELPKPLVPVGDRSILAHALASLAAAGFSEAVVNTHHLSQAFESCASTLPLPIVCVHEPSIRGTAGGIAGARRLLAPGPVVVMNGDILVHQPPVRALVERAGQGLALLVARRAAGEGTVGLDSRMRVVRLRGERFGPEFSGGDYVGVAALGARCLAELPETGCLVGDYALPELRRGRTIAALSAALDWTDAGDLASYAAANLGWLTARGGACWSGAGAELADGVTVESCVIGAAARVTGRGALLRVIAWPHARLEAPLANAVVTASGRVVPVE